MKTKITQKQRAFWEEKCFMSIYFRSSMGIDFPKAPYIGQVHYDFDLKRTFRYEEKPPEMALWTLDMFHWVDITEKDL